MNNSKKINYTIVDEVLMMDLSVRKTIEFCRNKGVNISIGALQKYKNFKSEQFKSEHLKSEQFKSEQFKSEHLSKSEHLKSEQFKSEQLKSEHLKSEQFKSEQFKSEQFKSEQLKSEQLKSIEVRYNDKILQAYENRHRNYRVDDLTDFPLYTVLCNDELSDFQFLDYEQLIKVGIEPRFIYDWKVGRCLTV